MMNTEIRIYLIEIRDSKWKQGVWEATNRAYSNLEAAKTWGGSPKKWKLTKTGWQMRRRYLNLKHYQIARIRTISLYIENYSPPLADVVQEGS